MDVNLTGPSRADHPSQFPRKVQPGTPTGRAWPRRWCQRSECLRKDRLGSELRQRLDRRCCWSRQRSSKVPGVLGIPAWAIGMGDHQHRALSILKIYDSWRPGNLVTRSTPIIIYYQLWWNVLFYEWLIFYEILSKSAFFILNRGSLFYFLFRT